MHCYSSRQELYYWLAGEWLELCVGQVFFLLWEALPLFQFWVFCDEFSDHFCLRQNRVVVEIM